MRRDAVTKDCSFYVCAFVEGFGRGSSLKKWGPVIQNKREIFVPFLVKIFSRVKLTTPAAESAKAGAVHWLDRSH